MADIQGFDERMQDGHFEAKWTGRPRVLVNPLPPAPEPEPDPDPDPEPDLDTFITEGGSILIDEMGNELVPE
jgi:hypothetical protein